MLSYKLVTGLRTVLVTTIITRNKKTATDPVQQLFIDKLREYKQKSPNLDFLNPSPAIIKELKKEHARIEKIHGGGPGIDLTTFPQFKFVEPKIDPIDEVTPETKGKGKGKGKDKKRGKKSEKKNKKKIEFPTRKKK